MTSIQYSKFSSLVFPLFLVICWLKPQGHYALNQTLNRRPASYHTVSVGSLLPFADQSSCNNVIDSSTTNGPSKKASLRVSHRYGACSVNPQGGNQAESSTNLAYEIISHDQVRVKSIKDRLENSNSNKDFSDDKTTNLPAHRGIELGTGNYVVDIGIGTPPTQVTMVFDTGSDITWTQCQPCAGSCYPQNKPIFDPSKSTSYSNISCSDPLLCSKLKSATGISRPCVNSACVYEIHYGDQSYSLGLFAKETLTLSGSDVLEEIPLGCGQNNKGKFGTTSGLIGLGRHPLSLVSQTAEKYGQVFSYCLPTTKSTSSGFLSFGTSALPANLRYTPFSTSGDSFYKIQMTEITVGGNEVPISSSVLQSDGLTIIDSGTVITRLPASIYRPMRDAFKSQMTSYKLVQPVSIFDTCYDFSDHATVDIPLISFYFSGSEVKVDVVAAGMLVPINGVSQVCLAFAEDESFNIFGNLQQQTLEVVYDVARGKIGFAPNACT